MRQFTVGLVGTGVISAAHLRAFHRLKGLQVKGVFDLNRELAHKRAAQFGVPKVYDNLSELIAACDVVDVCTPPSSHASIARDALAAGKYLLIEKPLVTDVTEWDGMIDLLGESKGQITVIHNLKFSPSVQQAKRWVDEGRIGRVIRVQREFLTSPSTDRMLVGSDHWSHKLPGGRWFETLPHELYLTYHFVGPMELDGASVIHGDGAPPGAPAEEVLITLSNNTCLATIHFSANCNQNRRIFTVQGTDGIISVDLLSDFAALSTLKDGRLKRVAGGYIIEAGWTLLRSLPDRGRYVWRHLRGESPHTRIIDAFSHFLTGEGEAPTPIDEVDYVVRNCERIGREIDRQVAELVSETNSGNMSDPMHQGIGSHPA
jgi:predicted dehydrogenase